MEERGRANVPALLIHGGYYIVVVLANFIELGLSSFVLCSGRSRDGVMVNLAHLGRVAVPVSEVPVKTCLAEAWGKEGCHFLTSDLMLISCKPEMIIGKSRGGRKEMRAPSIKIITLNNNNLYPTSQLGHLGVRSSRCIFA